ncbi:hypothetical protein CW304_05000 [Bacillus sp. UFRGS-B20]|nr:hypothetical protein CW304_05000 [Bacillus sp. UFRGS-B20]
MLALFLVSSFKISNLFSNGKQLKSSYMNPLQQFLLSSYRTSIQLYFLLRNNHNFKVDCVTFNKVNHVFHM